VPGVTRQVTCRFVCALGMICPRVRGASGAKRYGSCSSPAADVRREALSQLRAVRGGDRQLNRALHTIALHRKHHDPTTRDYIARRIAEGKTAREAARILKRYLARRLYRLLDNSRR
jgi:transposase